MQRIMVVDDEEQVRSAICKILERTNAYEVVSACNGKEALDRFKIKPVDLVITDITMPEKNGLDLINELVKEDEGIKIIAISGGGERFPEYFLPKAQEIGAAQFLKKPVRKDDLLSAVETILGIRGY